MGLMCRLFALILLTIAWSGASYACDMRTQLRPDNVADYIENGRDCLATPPQDYRFDEMMERAFVDKINAEREAHDLRPLTFRPEMRAAARFHSLDMAINDFFGHLSPARKSHAARIAAFDRTLLPRSSAENVAALKRTCRDWTGRIIACDPEIMAGTAEYQHRQLMNNPDHRKNILDPQTTHIALGVARNDQAVYVTQLFTQPAGTLAQPLPLRLSAGARLDVSADIPGWRIKRLALIGDRFVKDLVNRIIPLITSGDQSLSLKIERNDLDRIEFSYISGPAFTTIPAPEMTPSLAEAF